MPSIGSRGSGKWAVSHVFPCNSVQKRLVYVNERVATEEVQISQEDMPPMSIPYFQII